MPTLKILSETPIPLARVKEDLQHIKERDGELNFRAAKTRDYVNLFVGISAEKATELMQKLETLNIPRLKPEHVVKIVDLLPESVEELKNVLTPYTLTVSAENLSLIIDTLNPYLTENKSAVEINAQRAAAAAAAAVAAAQKEAEKPADAPEPELIAASSAENA